MVESVMRQEMETWLKKECQDVGQNLLWASKALDTALNSSLDLAIPERADMARSLIETTVNYAQIVTQRLPWELFTAGDREKISRARDGILNILPGDSPKEVQERVGELMVLIDQYLLEKTVECQCGKPGSNSSNPGGNKLAELKDGISKQIPDEASAVIEYLRLSYEADKMGEGTVAAGLRMIAEDERHHKDILERMVKGL